MVCMVCTERMRVLRASRAPFDNEGGAKGALFFAGPFWFFDDDETSPRVGGIILFFFSFFFLGEGEEMVPLLAKERKNPEPNWLFALGRGGKRSGSKVFPYTCTEYSWTLIACFFTYNMRFEGEEE